MEGIDWTDSIFHMIVDFLFVCAYFFLSCFFIINSEFKIYNTNSWELALHIFLRTHSFWFWWHQRRILIKDWNHIISDDHFFQLISRLFSIWHIQCSIDLCYYKPRELANVIDPEIIIYQILKSKFFCFWLACLFSRLIWSWKNDAHRPS